MLLQFNKVSYRYESSPHNIFDDITLHFSEGFTGIIGSNGSGKTTLLKLAANIYKPTNGNINLQGTVYYCEQRTDKPPQDFENLLYAHDKLAYSIKDRLEIGDDWIERWDTLSHGERKKWQIAAALFAQPDILLIDEPTNHIDYETKTKLVDALKKFHGICLIISHDRELLETLCENILSLDSYPLKIINSGFADFEQIKSDELNYNIRQKNTLENEIKKLEKEVKTRKRNASEADKNRSKRNISRKDHDAKSKMDLAKLTGKDAIEGKIYSRLSGRLDTLKDKRNAIGSTTTRELGIKIEHGESRKNVLLFYEASTVKLDETRLLSFPDLYVKSDSKIGLSGANGCGKTTLLESLIIALKEKRVTYSYIPQEITEDESQEILDKINNFKNEVKGKIFTIISRLNSEPKALFHSIIPSPGEVRKLLLAEALLNAHELIIMDEPTNHMDLKSIQCIEDALVEYNGALILVSHDKVFLGNTTNIKWEIEKVSEAENLLIQGY